MAIKKTEKSEETKINYDIKVTRVKEFNGSYAFDMVVNGVTIYGCWYREYERKDGSGTFAAIQFPSRKAEDGKYYNHAYFRVDEAIIADIEKQIEAML